MVLDTVGKSLGGLAQNALLVVDRSAKKLIVTPAYYTFRHFSQYIAAGSDAHQVTGSTDAVAFKNPDGSIITEVYNKGSASKTTTVAIGSVRTGSTFRPTDGRRSARNPVRRRAAARRGWRQSPPGVGRARRPARGVVGVGEIRILRWRAEPVPFAAAGQGVVLPKATVSSTMNGNT